MMKGLTGLVVAGALGLLAIGANMAYLHNKTKHVETVALVGIRQGVTIQTGAVIKEGDIEPVPIPKSRSETLVKYVYSWETRKSLVGVPATRPYRGGELVLVEDYRTPPPELRLEANEVLLPIDVSSKSPLIEPGDEVSFVVPVAPALPPRGASSGGESGETPPLGPGGGVEMHGPFRVGAVGNRIGSREVMRAYKIPELNPNQLGIVFKKEGTQLEARAMTLLTALQRVGNRNVTVILHSREKRE